MQLPTAKSIVFPNMKGASKMANPPLPKESEEQISFCHWLDALRIMYNHTPNEGKRSPITGQVLKAQGMRKGFPDIQIFDKPPLAPEVRGVLIEMKRQKSAKPHVTPEQVDMIQKLQERGYLATVCYGAGEAIEYCQSLGWGCR
jgi:hypothetical protein